MKNAATIAASLLLALAVVQPLALQPTPVRLALELQDYAALPVTADNTNTNTRAQLARVNYMRDEPSGRRFFVNDLNGPLYILDKQKKTEEQKARQPSDLTDSQWDHGSTDGEIFAVIKRGVPPTMMAGYDGRIPDADISGIVNYLRTPAAGEVESRALQLPRLAACAVVLFASLVGTSPASSSSTAAFAPRAPAPQRAGDTSTGDLPPEEQAKADEQSEATIRAVCVNCHPLESIVLARRAPAEWNTVMARMATLGASTTDEQFRMIRRYLTRYYGTIRVNSAPADEFSAVLGYSPKDAAAIVAYRQAHGRFADIEALAKVPGLDRAKLDEQPAALKFD